MCLAFKSMLKLCRQLPIVFLRSQKINNSSPAPIQMKTKMWMMYSLFLTLMSLLNEKVHTQIQTITSQDAQTPYDISSFNLDECIANIDPLLWKMLVILTRSVREGRKSNTEPIHLSHQRKLHCFYTHM